MATTRFKSKEYWGYTLPPQQLSSKAKTQEWMENCVDAVISMSGSLGNNGRTSKQTKQVNYDLYNSKFNEQDFEYVMDPYGIGTKFGDTPVKMQGYNIIRSKIELLKGEEIRRPFKFLVRGVGGNVVTTRQEAKKKMLLEFVISKLFPQGAPQDEQGTPMYPEQIQKYMDTQWVDPREQTANQLLDYLVKKEDIERKFNAGWEHALIVAEEVYHIGIVNGEPTMRVVNPLDFEYDRDSDSPYIADAQWMREERYLSPGAVIDSYGEYLSEAQVKLIDEHGTFGGMSNLGQLPGYGYRRDMMNGTEFSRAARTGYSIYVANVCWSSLRKVGILSYIDDQGEKVTEVVGDDFEDETLPAQATITWRWIREWWEGTRIGEDMYVNIHPVNNQPRSLVDLSTSKPPYVGMVYNATNTQATSLVDLIKAHQYTYRIVWYRLETELAKAKGKKLIMDIAQLPQSNGWSMDQWIYYFENLGVVFINSKEPGHNNPDMIHQFNQFKEIDMSLSQVVGQYMEILNKLEEQVATITGVSAQREGQVMASETATGTERATTQSSYITETWFYHHNEVKKQLLTQLLETAKLAYSDGRRLSYIVDEVYTAMVQMEEDMLLDSDYGVFVSNSSTDQLYKEKLEQLAGLALQQDKASLADIIRIYRAKSINEIESLIVKAEEARTQSAQQESEAARQSQERIEAQKIEWEREKLSREEQMNQMDNEAKIQVATISALKGKDGPSDMDGNGIPDPIEQGKLSLEQLKASFDSAAKGRELDHKSQELEFKRQESMVKQQAESNKMELEHKKVLAEMKKLEAEMEMNKREQTQQDALNKQELANKKVEQDHKSKELDHKAGESEAKRKESEAKAKAESQKIAAEKEQAEKDRKLEEKLAKEQREHEARENEKDRAIEKQKIKADAEIARLKIKEAEMKIKQQELAMQAKQEEVALNREQAKTDIAVAHEEVAIGHKQLEVDKKKIEVDKKQGEAKLSLDAKRIALDKTKPKPSTSKK